MSDSYTKPTPPNLQKLKGSYILTDNLREKSKLDHSILTGDAKSWASLKNVIDSYLDRAELWEHTPQGFALLLQKSLKKVSDTIKMQPVDSVSTSDLLLSEYCSSLHSFYSNAKIVIDLKRYYQKKELQKRAEDNQEQSHIQSAATASALIYEKSRLMEEESKKRSLNEDEEESSFTVYKSSQLQ